MPREADHYTIETCRAAEISEAEVASCFEIITSGGAVDMPLGSLRRARLVAIAREGKQIVGVGTIKRVNSEYAGKISKRSGVRFPPETPELGYVAVDEGHRNHGLSKRILAALVSATPGALFATTYNDRMKASLAAHGFVHSGNEWASRREPTMLLSLWLKNERTADGDIGNRGRR